MPSFQSISFACLLVASAMAAPPRPIPTANPTPSPEAGKVIEARTGRGPSFDDYPQDNGGYPYPDRFPPGYPYPPGYPRPNVPCPCTPKQSVVNPGFEFNGGTYNFWTTNDTTVATISGAYFDSTDTSGTHSLDFTLTPTHLGGSISQTVPICPTTRYTFNVGVYYDTTVVTTPSGCTLVLQIGNVASNVSLADPTIFATPPAGGVFIEIPVPFTSTNVTSINLSVGVVCTAAAAAHVPPPSIYVDNITIKP